MSADNAPDNGEARADAACGVIWIESPEHSECLFVIGGVQADSLIDDTGNPMTVGGLGENAHPTRPVGLTEPVRIQDELLEHLGQQVVVAVHGSQRANRHIGLGLMHLLADLQERRSREIGGIVRCAVQRACLRP